MNVYTTTLLFFFGFSNLVTALVVSRSSFLQQGTSSLILSSFGTKQPSSSSVEKTTTSRIRESADTFRLQIEHLIQEDPSLAGPLIRLAFHDATTLDLSLIHI